jgi:hypothetical protein
MTTKAETTHPDMPEGVAEYKARLEAETGKQYKYRPAKKDLPGIGHMLVHGAPESAGKPMTWAATIGYPLVLAITFGISLLIFHHAPHDKSVGRSHVLPNFNKKKVKPKLQHHPIQRTEKEEEVKPLRYTDLNDLKPEKEKEVRPLQPLAVSPEVKDTEKMEPLAPSTPENEEEL